MLPLLAFDLSGPLPEGLAKAVLIGLLIMPVLFLMKFYRRFDKFEETLAKRLETRILAGAAPKLVELQPSPLIVKTHQEFTPLHVHESMHGGLVKEFATFKERLEASIKTLGDDRTRSTEKLDSRIEEMDRRAGQRTEALRLEMKEDFRGVHGRINTVLEAVAEVRGKQTE